ncbi:uncharacterized protein E0L32_001329 [Thyridium curvatum]|uniref:lytic cellulose monooxygenase (C4-dehydrogenating) n=1 Tax=Thyridium curvatum TaxID=1093900 RepID=A0A507AKI8_9PEZI|nr:uncharacterized protein E0L32_001329 [Thyridium curvatum]TPX10132.1 hypothetical protein E0L32_001329 [Thyridium curvatum]
MSKTLLAALAGAATVAAHGHVTNIVINGVSSEGYNPFSFPYMQNPPTVVGWTTTQTDNGFVAPDAFGTNDIACHRGGKNAGGHAVVAAGDSVSLQWDTWPESHHGPVLDYLADCGAAGCEKADVASLEFFKIAEVGLVDGAKAPGRWGDDVLIANNNSWMVQIPAGIAPGNYVLRHEIIALHSAGQANGAQNYPQCVNLQVTGGGSDRPAGVKATQLYKASDAGIKFDIYKDNLQYPIPGPALYSGAKAISQGTSAITASTTALTGSATAAPGNGNGNGNGGGATTSPAAPAKPTSGNGNGNGNGGQGPRPTASAPASSVAPQPVPTNGCGSFARRHPRDMLAQ